MKSIEQLVQSIDARLEQLRADIEALTRARQKLVANDAAAAHTSAARVRRGRRGGVDRAAGGGAGGSFERG